MNQLTTNQFDFSAPVPELPKTIYSCSEYRQIWHEAFLASLTGMLSAGDWGYQSAQDASAKLADQVAAYEIFRFCPDLILLHEETYGSASIPQGVA